LSEESSSEASSALSKLSSAVDDVKKFFKKVMKK